MGDARLIGGRCWLATCAWLAAACSGPPPQAGGSTGTASSADLIPRDSIAARLADVRRIHTPEGVEVLESIEVNGSTQWLSIRGLNRANPILLAEFAHDHVRGARAFPHDPGGRGATPDPGEPRLRARRIDD